MEWSKEKTMKLIELLQQNASLWNPAMCESRRDKQRRKDELRHIAKSFNIAIGDIAKKVQHLRTQYNREAAREACFKTDDPTESYVSNWYAFEYLHFFKDPSKPFRILTLSSDFGTGDLDSDSKPSSPLHKHPRLDTRQPQRPRDEFTVFGEYIANELRSIKGEKNLLILKKKIQDAIYEIKMESMNQEVEPEHPPPLHPSHAEPPASSMNEITGIINNCHYVNFKVDQQ